jgi:hypothetical protein
VTSIAAGAVLYVWGIPAAAGLVAARVPVSWEERLGRAAVEQITASKQRCVDQEREEAIGTIVKRLLDPQPKALHVSGDRRGRLHRERVRRPRRPVLLLRGSSTRANT